MKPDRTVRSARRLAASAMGTVLFRSHEQTLMQRMLALLPRRFCRLARPLSVGHFPSW